MGELKQGITPDFFDASFLEHVINHPLMTNTEGMTYLPSVVLLSFARIMPILAIAPFLGAKIMPRPAKIALGICLFSIFFPHIVSTLTTGVAYNFNLFLLFFKELLIGTCIAYLVSVPFHITEAAGTIIDNQRGANSLQVNDPLMQNMSSPVGVLFNMLAIYFFWYLDGPFYFFDLMANSYTILPIDRFPPASFTEHNSAFWAVIQDSYNLVMVLSIKLATPSLVAILMTDTFLGIANRLAPQVQISFLGMPVKALFGIAILWVGWEPITKHMGKLSLSLLEKVSLLLSTLES